MSTKTRLPPPPARAHDLAREFIATMRPRVGRSLVQFASEEVVIPTGEYRGSRWSPRTQPWTVLLFDEIDSGRWPTIITTGPSQSGKTQSCFAIPALYTIAEFRENFVLGVPDQDMGDKKWRTDLQPIMAASPRLRSLLPTEGPGSRGGRVRDTIQFRNGVVCAVMSSQASDAAKAGFTARCIHITELGTMSIGREMSEEADPLRQFKARQRSFSRERRRLLGEGTVLTRDLLPWRLRGEDDGPLISSRSRLVTPCPHCGGWISPEREHFVGWHDAETEDEACNEATFICPLCNAALSETDRRKSNRDVKIVHHGQEITPEGDVVGELPPTSTLWFRYSQWNNLLLSSADLAEDEWKAAQLTEGTRERDDAERELCQFQWCLPYHSMLADSEPLEAGNIRKKLTEWPRNVLPPDTVKITVGVDLGAWTGWYVVVAWRKCGAATVIGYGNFDVKRSNSDSVEERIVHGLAEVAGDVFDRGWLIEGKKRPRYADEIWVDGGYMTDQVASFVSQKGAFRNNIYKMCRGRGASIKGGHFTQPRKISRNHPRIGEQWYASPNFKRKIMEHFFNADHWKLQVHEALRIESGKRGSLTLFRPEQRNEHAKISNHFANEQLIVDWVPDKGRVEKWVRKGENHWLDCAAMAYAAANCAGFQVGDSEEEPPPPQTNFYRKLLEKADAS